MQHQVRCADDRRIDILARGPPLYGGLPICGDAALVSVLHADGTPWRWADERDGVALEHTAKQHLATYWEVNAAPRLHFLMLGAELGGRISPEALSALHQLAAAKASEAPQLLQKRAQAAWHRRWLGMVSTTIQVAVAESLLEPSADCKTELSGWPPVPL